MWCLESDNLRVLSHLGTLDVLRACKAPKSGNRPEGLLVLCTPKLMQDFFFFFLRTAVTSLTRS